MKDVTPARTHYEAGFSDSFQHRRCFHKHRTLEAAAKCAMPYGPYGYVFAVEGGVGRELKTAEENVVRAIRFGKKRKASAESNAGEWVSSVARSVNQALQ
jgi:hypothetical protein